MAPNPRSALQTIVKTAELARQYVAIVEAGRDLSGLPYVESALLIWLRRMAEAVQKLTPAVKAMRPNAPWLRLGMFEHVDPLRPERFFAAYPEGVINKAIHKYVLPLGSAAAQILADIEAQGLPAKAPAAPAAYQFKVSLVGITPPIWRRLVISNQVTLHKLHMSIQIVGGWWNYHLHVFEIAGTEYGYPDPDGADGVSRSRKVSMNSRVRRRSFSLASSQVRVLTTWSPDDWSPSHYPQGLTPR